MDRIAWTRSLVSISFIPVLLRGEALYEIPLVCNAAINSSCARLRGRSLHWRSAGAGAVRVHRQRERRRYAAGTGRRRRRHGDRHCHYGVRYRRERERRHLTRRFPLIVETVARLRSRSCIIDGVASFDLVRHQRANRSIFLYAFDLIELNGDDLRRDPLEVRDARVYRGQGPTRHPVQRAYEGDGPTLFAHACKLGLEGIVSKCKDSAYRSRRSPDWLKMKNANAPAVKREAEEEWGKKKWR